MNVDVGNKLMQELSADRLMNSPRRTHEKNLPVDELCADIVREGEIIIEGVFALLFGGRLSGKPLKIGGQPPHGLMPRRPRGAGHDFLDGSERDAGAFGDEVVGEAEFGLYGLHFVDGHGNFLSFHNNTII